MDKTDKQRAEEDEGIFFSQLESVSLFYGALRVCSLLETATFTGEDSVAPDWPALKQRLLGILDVVGLDRFLRSLAPDDQLFEQKMIERADSDARCFTTTLDRLHFIRRTRGTFVESPKGARPWKGGAPHREESTEEAYNRLVGVLSVLSRFEYAFLQGAVPWDTYRTIVLETVIADWAHFYAFSLVTNSSRVSAWATEIPPEEIQSTGVNHPQIAWVEQWFREKDRFFNRLLADFEAAREQFFPTPPPSDGPDLGAPAANPLREQIERILDTLQDRLIARREALEKQEYHRLDPIDKNYSHLLSTLKQYGIEASTYQEARKAYERQFAPPPPPQNIRDKIRQGIRGRVRSKVELQRDCLEEIRLNPQWEDFIREEYQTEIDKLRGMP